MVKSKKKALSFMKKIRSSFNKVMGKKSAPKAKVKAKPVKKIVAKAKKSAPKKKVVAAKPKKTNKPAPKKIVAKKESKAKSIAKKIIAKAKPKKSSLPKIRTEKKVLSLKLASKKESSMSEPLAVGQSAPDFRVSNDQGQEVSLKDYRGKKVVLYFYPKDDTPGCTIEACNFRDGIAQIQAKGAEVLGVSADSVESHQKFKTKYDLNFPLLSDATKQMVQDYGVWKEKSMYGKTFMGIDRATFLIDENGKIAKIFPKVNVDTHYQEILDSL